MNYSEILPDVLAGKWVREKEDRPWVRMTENGNWVTDNPHLIKRDDVGLGKSNSDSGIPTTIGREVFNLDTWEVKKEIIYIWGACDEDGTPYIYPGKPIKKDGREWEFDDALIIKSNDNLFPKNKPQKYKLVPVDE